MPHTNLKSFLKKSDPKGETTPGLERESKLALPKKGTQEPPNLVHVVCITRRCNQAPYQVPSLRNPAYENGHTRQETFRLSTSR